MNKRTFLQLLGVSALAVGAAPVLSNNPELPRLAVDVQEFEQVAGIEIKISNMRAGTERVVMAVSNEPILIADAIRPVALVLSENDSTTVRMGVFEVKDGKWVEVTHSFAGIRSQQILERYGVMLDLYATTI